MWIEDSYGKLINLEKALFVKIYGPKRSGDSYRVVVHFPWDGNGMGGDCFETRQTLYDAETLESCIAFVDRVGKSLNAKKGLQDD